MKIKSLIVLVAVLCVGCKAQPHQKGFIGDRFQRDSGYWTRYNTDPSQDFYVTSNQESITFHLTNLSQSPQTKPVFSKDAVPYFIDVEYKDTVVAQLEPYPNKPFGPGEHPSDEWVLAPGETASGVFPQSEIAKSYWLDTYLRPVLWEDNTPVRFNFNGRVSNPCVVRRRAGVPVATKWTADAPLPIYFECNAALSSVQKRKKDNIKRLPLSIRFGWKKVESFQYQ